MGVLGIGPTILFYGSFFMGINLIYNLQGFKQKQFFFTFQNFLWKILRQQQYTNTCIQQNSEPNIYNIKNCLHHKENPQNCVNNDILYKLMDELKNCCYQ